MVEKSSGAVSPKIPRHTKAVGSLYLYEASPFSKTSIARVLVLSQELKKTRKAAAFVEQSDRQTAIEQQKP